MKVAVTGANGFLGRGIVKELSSRGVDVIAVDRGFSDSVKAYRVVRGSIFDMHDPYDELGSPDCVVHLAWRDGFRHDSGAHMEDLPKHVALVKSLATSPLKRLAVMGTMHEIGYFEGGIRSDTPCAPQSMYGIAKNAFRQASEVICKDSGTDLFWLRGFYIVDNSTYGASIFSKICQAVRDGKKTFPFTSGRNLYDFVDYAEFCNQVADYAVGDIRPGTYNVCSGRPERLAERVERFIKENDFDIKLEYGAFPDRAYDSPAVWGHKEVDCE